MNFSRGVERYRLDWPGKREAARAANTPITKTLRPCREKSAEFDTTENIVIEGDNLDALKLLQRSYLSKIKLIYIDPPYNTGKDFVYCDNFQKGVDDYKAFARQLSETGERLVANPDTSGRFHSDWLSMMYPRLKVARNLLREDGVIFISIDNGEVHNLRKLCDEILGESNFIADIVWRKKPAPANDAKHISDTHDFILVYAKNCDKWEPQLVPRTPKQLKSFKNLDDDPRGLWRAGDLSAKTYSESFDYPIVTPSGNEISPPSGTCWRYSKERFNEMVKDNRIWFGRDGSNVPTIKRFLTEVKTGVTPVTIWSDKERDKKENKKGSVVYGYNTEGRKELKDLFDGQGLFDNPKPVSLIEHIIYVANVQQGDIVLDFFAGSGTTAHAVMKYSAEKSCKVNFLLVQLDESTKADSHAYKAGYPKITDVTVDRIKRARSAVEGKYPKFSFQDYGFRTFKVDSSNLKDNFYNPAEISQDLLPSLVETVKSDRTNSEDLLFQVICDEGMELTLPIERVDIEEVSAYIVGTAPIQMIACFEGNVTMELVEELARRKPSKLLFSQAMFDNDALVTNVVEFLKQKSPAIDIAFL